MKPFSIPLPLQSGSLALTVPASLLVVLWLVLPAISSLTTATGHFDDGIQLVGAMMAQLGQRPNIDFYAVYPPLNTYLLAAAFSALGRSIVTYHLYQLAMSWLTVATVVLGCVLLTGQRGAALLVACVALVLNAQLSMLQNVSALAFSTLASVAYLVAGTKRGAARHWISAFSGAAVAALLWTRANFALYFFWAWAWDAGARMLEARRSADAPQTRALFTELGCFAAAVLVGAGLVFFAWGGSLTQLFLQVVTTPSKALVTVALHPLSGGISPTGLRQLFISGVLMPLLPIVWLAVTSRDLSGLFGRNVLLATALATGLCIVVLALTIPRYLPLASIVPIGLLSLHVLRQRGTARYESFVLLLLSLQTHYVMSRPDGSHFYSTFPVFALLIGLRVSEPALARTTPALLAAAAVGLFPALYQVHAWLLPGLKRAAALETVPVLLATQDERLFAACEGTCARHVADTDELEAARYVRDRTAPTEAVFAGLQHNDDDSVNSVRSYWLMGRPAGTRDLMMIFGVTSPHERQRAMAADLERNHVRWAVLWRGEDLTGTHALDSPLDQYIHAHFQPRQTFGDYVVWNRP